MSDELYLGVGPAHEFELTARKVGWTMADFNRLAQNEELNRGVLSVLRGQAEIAVVTHIIDCDVDPSITDGWTIAPEADQIKSRVRGKVTWNSANVLPFLIDGQKDGRTIKGTDLRQELEGKAVYTANVLDFYLANPHLIPDSWKGKATFFWGTVYRRQDGDLYVRCLSWHAGHWNSYYDWLYRQFNDLNPAVVSAS